MQPFILITYNECIFLAYDGSRNLQIPNKEQPLQKKDNDCLIYISDFLTKVYGHFALSDKMQIPDVLKEACIIMHLKKNNDRQQKAEDLVNQMVEYAILIFEARFLGCQALFIFDNASSHAAFLPNVFVAKYMNLSPKGKQPKIHSAYFGDRIQ